MIESQIHYVTRRSPRRQGRRAGAGAQPLRQTGPTPSCRPSWPARVEHRRLQQLVPRRTRRQPDPVERHDCSTGGTPARSNSPNTSSSAWERVRVRWLARQLLDAARELVSCAAVLRRRSRGIHAGVVVGGHEIQQQARTTAIQAVRRPGRPAVRDGLDFIEPAFTAPGPYGQTASRPATRGVALEEEPFGLSQLGATDVDHMAAKLSAGSVGRSGRRSSGVARRLRRSRRADLLSIRMVQQHSMAVPTASATSRRDRRRAASRELVDERVEQLPASLRIRRAATGAASCSDRA